MVPVTDTPTPARRSEHAPFLKSVDEFTTIVVVLTTNTTDGHWPMSTATVPSVVIGGSGGVGGGAGGSGCGPGVGFGVGAGAGSVGGLGGSGGAGAGVGGAGGVGGGGVSAGGAGGGAPS